jgi:preprotein translocase subunit SecE
MRRLFSSSAVKVQISDEYVTTGLIIILYVLIVVFFFRSFDFISFELA